MLRSGIIGLGRMGWSYDGGRYRGDGRSLTHASCLARHAATVLVAGHDSDPEQRERFTRATGVKAVETPQELFAERLDLVTIASPSPLHAEHVRAAIEAGVRYIWLEKPPTLSLAEHRAILALAEASDTRIAVNYPRSFMPQYAALAERASRHPPVAVQVDYSRSLSVNGVHLIDQVGMLFPGSATPRPERITGSDIDNPSFAFSCGDAEVLVTGMALPYHCIDLRIIDEAGRTSVIRGGLEAWFERRADNQDYPGFYHLAPREPLIPAEACQQAMREASYACLANLVDPAADLISSLRTALFAAEMLDHVEVAFGR